ncbi:methylated-DNA--[protein]-cysteine S-methyltransferase [bacterium]|nr:methylated-DNA--[protein]-cysteine S-methyltransferase [bacterium]
MAALKKVPRGRVVTYSQLAKMAGKPHAARAVAWVLHACSQKYRLPWHRVVSSKGKISFAPETEQFLRQRERLVAEKVRVEGWDGRIDMERFRFQKRKKT